MGKSAPPPPDYTGAAEAQGKSSQANIAQQTAANRPNQNTPFASSQWVQGPDGQWHQTTGFTGQLGDAANGLQGQIAQNFGQPMMTGDAARNQAISATYDQMASRLNPQFQQGQSQLDAQLANQGLSPGSAAYRQAESQFARNKNDAFQGAANNAVQQGLQAQNLTFNQNLAARNAPLQELQGVAGFLGMPGFQGAGAADPTQYLAAALGLGNYNLQNAQMQNQALVGLFSGLGSLAGGGLGALLGGAAPMGGMAGGAAPASMMTGGMSPGNFML